MKVLQVNVVYKKGSTGKIISYINEGLKNRGIEAVLCYGRGKTYNEENVYKTSAESIAKINAVKSRITGLQYNGAFVATRNLIKIIENEKPDIVHLHCINGHFVNIYKLINYLKENNINTLLTLHAEFMFTGACGHSLECTKWKDDPGCGNCPQLWDASKSIIFDRTSTSWRKMRDAFKDFNKGLIIASVSPWLMHRAMQSPILADKCHCTVLNGVDTVSSFNSCDYSWIKERHSLNNEKIILHVTPRFEVTNDSFKGGRFIVDLAERLKQENVKIVVVGPYKRSHIALPSNLIMTGQISNAEELAAYYSIADLCVTTSKRETFSMVTAESLCCGTPVVGFKAGGTEEIALEDFSAFVEYGDMDALEEKVDEWIYKKIMITGIMEKIAHEKYSKETMINNYIELYNALHYQKWMAS